MRISRTSIVVTTGIGITVTGIDESARAGLGALSSVHWAWMRPSATNVIGKAEGTAQMKQLTAAAIVLFSSTTIGFAGNFTPVPKNKIVQS